MIERICDITCRFAFGSIIPVWPHRDDVKRNPVWPPAGGKKGSPVASCNFCHPIEHHRSDPRCCCLTSYLLIFTEHNNTLLGIVPPTSKLRCSVSRSCHPPNHHRPRTEMSWRAFPPLLSSAAATPPPDPPALGSGCPSPSTRCS